jgi:hypothetical protein
MLYQLLRRGGQGGERSLREAHAKDKVLVFAIAQLQQTVP